MKTTNHDKDHPPEWFTPGMLVIEIRNTNIVSFVREGETEPSEVHIVLELMDTVQEPLLLRLKSAQACDQLIEALLIHRRDVFGAEAAGKEIQSS